MKWTAIAGSWRIITPEVEKDVRHEVRESLRKGHGIVTCGALGVDYFAADEALLCDKTAKSITIYLPTHLEAYIKHYLTRASEGEITLHQAGKLVEQLTTIQKLNPSSVRESDYEGLLDQSAYFARISTLVTESDELIAFQVNTSEGTQDTINKAKAKGIPVKIYSYTTQAECDITHV
jgi:hypothetical protein